MLVESKNSFANHALFWWLTATFLSVLFLPAILAPKEFAVTASEVEFFSNIGRDVDAVTTTSNHIFITVFEETGVTKIAGKLFKKPGEKTSGPGSVTGFDWAAEWAESFFRMVYRGMWRLIALWPIYIGGFVSFCVPALVDGLVARSKRRYDFKQSNPIFFYGAAHTAAMAIGMAVFIPIIPVEIGTLMITAFFLVVAGSFWVGASNFQTGQ